jgi:hypothetical protein
VHLAIRCGERGSISRNVTPDRWELVPGFVWMAAAVPGYAGGQRIPGRPGHNLTGVRNALRDCGSPPGFPGLDAWGVFAGYLVLDAWVANQDRHDRNWAVLNSTDGPVARLAPSFDHTSSLGFNLRDAARQRALGDPGGIAKWASGGRANQFEHDPALPKSAVPTLVELAHRALQLDRRAAEHWRGQLRAVDSGAVEAVVARVPGLSDPTARFILELVTTNRRRLIGDR